MSFRGRGGRGGGFGRGGGGRGGGGFGGRRFEDQGPPEQVIHFGDYLYPCETDLIVKAAINDVPFFNAPIYLEDKTQIGKIDEIFGNIREYYVSIKLSDNVGLKSFDRKHKLFIDPMKLLPLQRFLPQPPGAKRGGGGRGRGGRGGGGGRGGRGGGGRGGFGGGRGGRGGGGFGRGGGGGFGRGGGGGRFSGGGGGGGGRGGGGRFSGGGRGKW